jgi:shikimate dehydrogenase
MLVELGRFTEAVSQFREAGGQGLNVTLPFKQEAWALADVKTARADAARSVNTLWFAQGRIHGDTTDGVGLIRDYLYNHGGRIAERRVLVLGAGGAVRGVMGALLAEKPRLVVIANRTPSKALAIAADLRDERVTAQDYADLAGHRFDLIINGTAASLQGDLPPLPPGLLADGGDCYDLMYAAAPTPFVRWGRDHGAVIAVDGLGMLVEQAAESFFIWRGVRPETGRVIRDLRNASQTPK